MEFAAIDVETANADLSSICQIGIACYLNGSVQEEWKTYVDPEDDFEPWNTKIHGIDQSTVRGLVTLPLIHEEIIRFLDDRIVVCHTDFDRVAIKQAMQKYDLPQPKCRWLDTARVARRTWREFKWRGYGLANVCSKLGYDFKHHDALEDAKAAAFILLRAIKDTEVDVKEWLKRVELPIDASVGSGANAAIRREGDPNGPLYGEVLVFTGALEIPRREAADMAARLGCAVESGVTKRTSLLVVGDQDIRKLGGKERSAKHRKAEALIGKGQAIRILRESDFKALVASPAG